MGMTLAEELELVLERDCSSRCLDDPDDRKAVAERIAEYLHEESDDEAKELRPGASQPG